MTLKRRNPGDPQAPTAEPEADWSRQPTSCWLSHVPPERFEEFWALVDRALAPGGGVFFLDNLRNPEATAAGHDLGPPGSNTLTRTLEDGRSFEIVKVFYEPEELEQRLYQLGWIFAVRQTAEHFLVANGMRGRIEPIERQS